MNDEDIDRLEEINQKVASSVILLEEATQKIEDHELVTGKRLQASEIYFEKRMEEIKSAVSELQTLMTQGGITRFRMMAEHTVQEGREHLLEIQRSAENFHSIVQENMESLNQTAENVSNWIAESIKSLKLDDFRRLMIESISQIDELSREAVKKVNKITRTRWFHWEKLGIAVVIAIVVSFLMALFINDELPWESHKRVIAERRAGKVLNKAWPHLTVGERAFIRRLG